jgi:hypothetical protein
MAPKRFPPKLIQPHRNMVALPLRSRDNSAIGRYTARPATPSLSMLVADGIRVVIQKEAEKEKEKATTIKHVTRD